jgi:hypothetical protein
MEEKAQPQKQALQSQSEQSQEFTNQSEGGLSAQGPDAAPALQRQQAANLSPQVSQLRSLQSAINASQQVQQFRKTQEAATASPLQRKATTQAPQAPVQRKENKTGMPDNLKAGMESLSGMAMDDVKVHYNSDKPRDVQAHAYAQGSDIHLAPGQEKHLPHEAWHVVQQRQGRVQPTTQVGGAAVNDDAGLESEADVMGSKALQMKVDEAPAPVSQLKFAGGHASGCCCGSCTGDSQPMQRKAVMQRAKLTRDDVIYWEDLINEELDADPNNPQWNYLFGLVEEGEDAGVVQHEYVKLKGKSVHASGYAYGNGMLFPQYHNVRGCFFPSGYDATASQHRDDIVDSCTDPTDTDTWQCPSCLEACDKNTYGEDVTIDHKVDCATYWNNQGRDESKQDRIDFYNDTTNHEIMCRSCNSSKNSGGITYRRMVGNNFTH